MFTVQFSSQGSVDVEDGVDSLEESLMKEVQRSGDFPGDRDYLGVVPLETLPVPDVVGPGSGRRRNPSTVRG